MKPIARWHFPQHSANHSLTQPFSPFPLLPLGLDIAAVGAVVSLDAPRDVPSYLHRCGRTARAGADGIAVTLAEEKDRPLLKALAAAARAAAPAGGASSAGAGGGALRERRVDPAGIAAWRTRLESLSDALEHVTVLEKEEALHRRADMEASKAEHLLEHAEDIAARPARSWFQSEGEKARGAKKATQAAARAPVTGGEVGLPAAKKVKPAKPSRKRDDEGDEDGGDDKRKKGRRGEEEGGEGGAGGAPRSARDDPAAVARRGAALAKGAARRALAAGMRPAAAKEAARGALRKDAKIARRKAMRADGGARKDAGPEQLGGLFSGDGINGSKPGAGGAGLGRGGGRAGGGSAGKRGAAPAIPDGAGAPRALRGGGKAHKSGFKSKKRYRRK
jgi:ATP-dependent RNA helicase DDX27